MTTVVEQKRSRAATWGWRILVALSGLLTLNGVGLYVFIADTHIFRTAALIEAGLGAVALVAAWEGRRSGARWAWNATGVLVAVLAALTVHIFVGGEPGIALWYLFLTAAGAVGQALAARG
ncbi:MAG: hypothetical protein R3272_07635 [Candidatus Promineifilaceae bacterium]|nr:hypothetical protein [Candidatus Promineifilaceae bacterium]